MTASHSVNRLRRIVTGVPRRLKRLAKAGARRVRTPLRRLSTAHGLILMYHRIAEDSFDPWDVCVSPGRFREQLEVLSDCATVVPLTELRSRLKVGRKARPSVAITFDDGYADNLHEALPALESFDMPATVFISTSWIGGDEPFWWDFLATAVLGADELPKRLRFNVAEEEFEWSAASSKGGAVSSQGRAELLLALWRRLQATEGIVRSDALDELARQLGSPVTVDADARPMTVDEVRRLAESRLVEIGAHTMSHCPLPKRSAEEQFREIAGSRDRCADITGGRPTSFAYPYGEYDPGTPALVARAGFDRACSTEQDLLWNSSDPFLMPRFTVRNWDGEAFQRRLTGEWLL